MESVPFPKSYYNLSLHGVCLSLNSSAVCGSTGTKLCMELGDGCGIRLETLVSMETKKAVAEKKKTVSRLTCWPDDHEFLYVKLT